MLVYRDRDRKKLEVVTYITIEKVTLSTHESQGVCGVYTRHSSRYYFREGDSQRASARAHTHR